MITHHHVLQHDMGHQSQFETKLNNEIASNLVSPFTFAPFRVMKQNHNLHHAGVWQRLFYRLYRNPFVLILPG